MKPYRAILFDLDGTLIETTELIVNCFRFSLATLGLEFSEEEIRLSIGKPLREQFIQFFKERPHDVLWEPNALRARLRETWRFLTSLSAPLQANVCSHFPKTLVKGFVSQRPMILWEKDLAFLRQRHMEYQLLIWKNYVRLFDPIEKILKHLQAQKISLAIVTSRYHQTTDLYMKALQIDHFFPIIITPEDTVRHKPHGEPIRAAITRLSALTKDLAISPDECLYVGDTIFDGQAAHHAGTDFFYVHWPSEAATDGLASSTTLGERESFPVTYSEPSLEKLLSL